MTEYAYRLDISTEGALKVDLDEYFADKADKDIMRFLFPHAKPEELPLSAWQIDGNEVLNREWMDYVQSKLPSEVELRDFTMFFVRQGNPPFNAHIDVAPYDPPMICVFGMNFVLLDDDPTEMIWFKRNDGIELDPRNLTSYSGIQKQYLDEIGRAKMNRENLTLVNTCEFHDIDNHGGKRRWCVSLRSNMPYETWEQAVEAFRPLFKSEDK